ncbi:MAG: hypothetical protein KatS3mg002_0909 [Candidatus Woesearchaeota archaeon]|nr:MAG: hypothetical protein KatS3mg002_0909 [Candidatus Woesearchaeota archaeon]
MIEEELLDSLLELEIFLKETEELLSKKEYSLASKKIQEAREIIEQLKEEDESNIDSNDLVGVDVMRTIK